MKPQDILILLKLIVLGDRDWIYDDLAKELFMSKSSIHAGLSTSFIKPDCSRRRSAPSVPLC
ncbi:MAG: hypothetical protein ABFS56_16270 [Pseudomonadota bacterium]